MIIFFDFLRAAYLFDRLVMGVHPGVATPE